MRTVPHQTQKDGARSAPYAMADIHPTAIIEGDVTLADDVIVGPQCTIDGTVGPVTVGAGSELIGHIYLCGPLTIGAGNTLYPFVSLGYAPQSRDFDPSRPGHGLVIGDHNVFREGASIHRALTDQGPTRVGNHNYFMAYTHAGHDVRINNHCTFANGSLIAGHVIVDDQVTVGGNASIHQFCRIGRGAMLSGSMGLTRDVPPFFMLTGSNIVGSLNIVGMRRLGLPSDQIDDVRWVYRTVYRRKLTPPGRLEALQERADRPIVAEYIEFLKSMKRGLCPDHPKLKRLQ